MGITDITEPASPEEFPGAAAWRWHMQLKAERILAHLRIILVLTGTVAWAAGLPRMVSGLLWLTLLLSWVYALVEGWVILRRPQVLERMPYASVLLDLGFAIAWVFETGGGHSLFLPALFCGVAAAPIRLDRRRAMLTTLAYTVAYYAAAGPPAVFAEVSILLIGLGLTLWNAVIHSDRRNSLRDALTGAFGREYGLMQLEHLLRNGPWPLTLGIVDLDGFKGVNDRYGHPAGDGVLVQCVRIIEEQVRAGDLVARLGGDEFLVLLPASEIEEGVGVAERIRAAFEKTTFHLRHGPAAVNLTISIGLAEGRKGTGAAALVQTADERLYAAKSGHNRVVGATPPESRSARPC